MREGILRNQANILIKEWDEEHGEAWSNSTDDIVEIMVAFYIKMYKMWI